MPDAGHHLTTATLRDAIRAELASLEPFDRIERDHIDDALRWVDSGAELFRRAKPATPAKHLVAYTVVVDRDHVLLVDHAQAGLWLPPGGHVEPGEHPRDAVVREMLEELGVAPQYPVAAPAMVTCTETVGRTAGHVDVSLWYRVSLARERLSRSVDDALQALRWFAFNAVPLARSDPHLGRFIAKQRWRSEGAAR